MRYTEEMIAALKNEAFIAMTSADALLASYQRIATGYWRQRLLDFFDAQEFGLDCELEVDGKTYVIVGIKEPSGIDYDPTLLAEIKDASRDWYEDPIELPFESWSHLIVDAEFFMNL